MQTSEQIRADHANINNAPGDRAAVIVKTAYSARKFNLGVQFWTNEMITAGQNENTDGTTSKFIELL